MRRGSKKKDQGNGVRGWTIIKTNQNEPIVHVLAALDSEHFHLQFFFFIPISITAKERIARPAYRLRQRWTVILKNEKAESVEWHSRRVCRWAIIIPTLDREYTFIYRLILPVRILRLQLAQV